MNDILSTVITPTIPTAKQHSFPSPVYGTPRRGVVPGSHWIKGALLSSSPCRPSSVATAASTTTAQTHLLQQGWPTFRSSVGGDGYSGGSKCQPSSPRNKPCFLPSPRCLAGGLSTQLMRTGSGVETDLPSLSTLSLSFGKVWKSRSRIGDTPSPRKLVTNQSSSPSLLIPRFSSNSCQMPSSPLTLKKTQTHQTDDSEHGVPHHRGLRPSQQHSPRALTGGFC